MNITKAAASCLSTVLLFTTVSVSQSRRSYWDELGNIYCFYFSVCFTVTVTHLSRKALWIFWNFVLSFGRWVIFRYFLRQESTSRKHFVFLHAIHTCTTFCLHIISSYTYFDVLKCYFSYFNSHFTAVYYVHGCPLLMRYSTFSLEFFMIHFLRCISLLTWSPRPTRCFLYLGNIEQLLAIKLFFSLLCHCVTPAALKSSCTSSCHLGFGLSRLLSLLVTVLLLFLLYHCFLTSADVPTT